MLPIRLIIATIKSISFYQTGRLVYLLIIHNTFDTLNLLGVIAALKAESA